MARVVSYVGSQDNSGSGNSNASASPTASGLSLMVGMFFHANSSAPVASNPNVLAVVPGTVVNGAIDHPLWAAAYPEYVSGDDIVFPTNVDGMFMRNTGGLAASEGQAQADATAPNGLFVQYTAPTQPQSDFVGGTGNGVRSTAPSLGIVTGDPETRPANRAYQLYTIVD